MEIARKQSKRQDNLEETKKGDLRPKLTTSLCFSTHPVSSRWGERGGSMQEKVPELRGEAVCSHRAMVMSLKMIECRTVLHTPLIPAETGGSLVQGQPDL